MFGGIDMKAKKIIIAVFAVVLAMQMTGCKNNIDTSKPVVIGVSVSENDIESKAELTWTELGDLKTCEKMRTAVDKTFGNEIVDGVKYGPFYIDSQGNQCTNNTLKVVLGNRYVAEMFATGGNVDIEKVDSSNLGAIESTTDSDEDASTAMTESFNSSLASVYNDLSDSDQSPALFNAYFNLLPDSTPNYFNGGDTLSRAEAMSLVTRATTPVQSLNVSDDFTSAVTGTDYDQYINYAAQQNEHSYINTNDKSLTADNFKGAMSRAEFIYLIMNEVYGADEVQNYDTSKTTLKDCTNAGNLSEKLKIADSDRCNGYTLKYSLENIDKGVAEELYKPIAMAADKGIITTETRWNEGITKSEAIEIVVNAFMQYYDEQGYLVNNALSGFTQALEVAAEALWGKQDQNDMSCTKEEFIADYIKLISDGMSPEEFEKSIEGKYSIKFAEEMEKKEQENILNTHIRSLWENLKDRLTCDESKFTEEYKSQLDKEGDSFNEDNFAKYILDKYGKQEETKPSSNNNNSNNGGGNNSSSNGNGGSSNNNYTPPANPSDNGGSGSGSGGSSNGGSGGGGNDQPSYTPPTDNGGSGGSDSGGSSGDDFADLEIPIGDPDDEWFHLGGTD
mgnify:CR=1 FL=1